MWVLLVYAKHYGAGCCHDIHVAYTFIMVLLDGCLGAVGDGLAGAMGQSQKPHLQVSVIFQLLDMTQVPPSV